MTAKRLAYGLKNAKRLRVAARRHGTPLYLLDKQRQEETIEEFTDAFRSKTIPVTPCYALKANDLPFLARLIAKSGWGADAASDLELELALKTRFKRIIVTSPYKSPRELLLAARNNDRVILVFDNIVDLTRAIEKIPESRKVKALFRIALQKNRWDKFGLTETDLLACLALTEGSSIEPYGIHFHASWNKTATHYVRHLRRIGELLDENPSIAGWLKVIDIGGGFVPSNDSRTPLAKVGRKIRRIVNEEIARRGLSVQLLTESGRFIATPATTILTRVIDVRKGNLYVDAGIHLVGAYPDDVTLLNLTRPSDELQEGAVFGPLCDPHDRWANRYFGEKAKPGDVIGILDQGAYTRITAWRWQRPVAPYVLLDRSSTSVLQRRETFAMRYPEL